MDCRTCEPTLIDLVHDELATDAAADARAHLAECASCRASFERLVAARKLAEGLEVERPPQPAVARLLQLAETRAAELRAEAAPKAAAPTFWRKMLDFVARFAMGRQVGMATIMLLIVAVGLWSLPRLRRAPVAGGTVVDAEDDGEAAPSPGVEPADRLALKVDPRSRRIRSNDGQETFAPGALPAAPAPAPAAQAAEEVAPAKTAEAKGADDPLARLDDVDDLIGAKKEDAPAELRQRQVPSVDDLLEGALAEPSATEPQAHSEAEASTATRRSTEEGPQAFPASAQAAAEPDVAEAAPAPPQAQAQSQERTSQVKAKRAASAAGVQAPAAPAPRPTADLLRNAYAASGGSTSAPTQSAASLLEAARSVTRTRGCAAALSSYERVVATAPQTTAAGTALIEMAQCKRSLGLMAEAQRLLERAALIPSTRDRARALLEGAGQAAPAASP